MASAVVVQLVTVFPGHMVHFVHGVFPVLDHVVPEMQGAGGGGLLHKQA